MKRWMERSWEHLTSWSISEGWTEGGNTVNLRLSRQTEQKALTLEALDALQCNSQQRVLDVTARLEGAAVGVDVDVSNGSLDADAAVGRSSGVGVQHVHKLGVVRRQGVLVVCVLKGGTGGVQAYRGKGETAKDVCVSELAPFLHVLNDAEQRKGARSAAQRSPAADQATNTTVPQRSGRFQNWANSFWAAGELDPLTGTCWLRAQAQ